MDKCYQRVSARAINAKERSYRGVVLVVQRRDGPCWLRELDDD